VNRWKVELDSAARKDLRELAEGPQQAAIDLLEDLAEDPAGAGAVEMRGKPNTWRVRFHGNYRLIYRESRTQNRIIVLRIRPRETAYEGMED
jgi:mRNA-degrading endonuclease RelE of RelBE toxin-antitoxin system